MGSLCKAAKPSIKTEENSKHQNKRALLKQPHMNQIGLSEAPPIVHEVLRLPGRPLDQETRVLMESRLGHDFSQIRIHTDTKAAESAKIINATAYAVGRDIVFGIGAYEPTTELGQQLIAHELTHSIQQQTLSRYYIARRTFGEMELAAQYKAEKEQSTKVALSPSANTLDIQPGDVVVRAGTFSGKNPLVSIIGEQYNHGGVAIDSNTIHHVEANGYETVAKSVFFDPANASGGAVLRFQGPFAAKIRSRVVEIARSQRYVKIPGNPFSTAENLKTINCNEFVHELFRQAIAELMAEVQQKNPKDLQTLLAEYGDSSHAGQVKKIIEAKTVEFQTGGLTTGPAIKAAELLARTGVTSEALAKGEVHIEYEGRLEMRNLFPHEWATSWNPFKVHSYQKGFYTIAVLRTFTPNSFVNSKYFTLVGRMK